MSREEALHKLNHPPYSEGDNKVMLTAEAKIKIYEEELMKYHDMPRYTKTLSGCMKLVKRFSSYLEKISLYENNYKDEI